MITWSRHSGSVIRAAGTSAVLLATTVSVQAQTPSWDGGGSDNLWSNPANWDPDGVPADGASGAVRFNGTAPGVVDLDGGNIELDNEFYLDGGSYTFTNGTLTVSRYETETFVGAADVTFRTTMQAFEVIPGFTSDLVFAQIFQPVGDYVIDGHNGGLVQDNGATPTKLLTGHNVHLLGDHTHSGGTEFFLRGTFDFDSSGAFGSGFIRAAGGNGGGINPIGDVTLDNEIQLLGEIVIGGIDTDGPGTLTHTGDLALVANGSLQLVVGENSTYTLEGQITEPDGPITDTNGNPAPMILEGGNFVIAAPQSHNAVTYIDAASVKFDNDQAFSSGAIRLREVISGDGEDDPLGFGATLEAINGTRTLANDIEWRPGDAQAATIKGDIVHTGAFSIIGDRQINVDAGGRLALNGSFMLFANPINSSTTVRIGGDGTGTVELNTAVPGISGLDVVAGGTLTGNGSVEGVLTVSGGTVNPGASAGTFTVTGDTTIATAGTLAVELGGTNAGAFDKLVTTGTLSAGGTLDVSLINGFAPGTGDSFDILDFNAVTGAFDSILLPTLGGSLSWNTDDLLTTGVLSVIGDSILLGDLDGDGDVDGVDIDPFVQILTGNLPYDPAGDFDGDGDVDGVDIDPFVAALSGSGVTSSALTTLAAVPEPTTLAMFGLAGLAALGRRRRAH